ncbi:hypothetical protein JTE90_005092 [Oedothorax gibbosus]|uniref:Uncharacterized protein n=1 Tax=Oedothorax gibbosus TaxID=931172 RepID=A0AAV6VBV6_9ARAC|nr:hypothetical protein JTE90_005092 [Oedothorax gibbosus]
MANSQLSSGHAVLFPQLPASSPLDYLQEVGAIIGSGQIHSFYISEGFIKIYLKERIHVEQVSESGIVVLGQRLQANNLETELVKLTLSRVDPILPDNCLEDVLKSYGTIASPITHHKTFEEASLAHVDFGVRCVNLNVFNGVNIPDTIQVQYKDISHAVDVKFEKDNGLKNPPGSSSISTDDASTDCDEFFENEAKRLKEFMSRSAETVKINPRKSVKKATSLVATSSATSNTLTPRISVSTKDEQQAVELPSQSEQCPSPNKTINICDLSSPKKSKKQFIYLNAKQRLKSDRVLNELISKNFFSSNKDGSSSGRERNRLRFVANKNSKIAVSRYLQINSACTKNQNKSVISDIVSIHESGRLMTKKGNCSLHNPSDFLQFQVPTNGVRSRFRRNLNLPSTSSLVPNEVSKSTQIANNLRNLRQRSRSSYKQTPSNKEVNSSSNVCLTNNSHSTIANHIFNSEQDLFSAYNAGLKKLRPRTNAVNFNPSISCKWDEASNSFIILSDGSENSPYCPPTSDELSAYNHGLENSCQQSLPSCSKTSTPAENQVSEPCSSKDFSSSSTFSGSLTNENKFQNTKLKTSSEHVNERSRIFERPKRSKDKVGQFSSATHEIKDKDVARNTSENSLSIKIIASVLTESASSDVNCVKQQKRGHWKLRKSDKVNLVTPSQSLESADAPSLNKRKSKQLDSINNLKNNQSDALNDKPTKDESVKTKSASSEVNCTNQQKRNSLKSRKTDTNVNLLPLTQNLRITDATILNKRKSQQLNSSLNSNLSGSFNGEPATGEPSSLKGSSINKKRKTWNSISAAAKNDACLNNVSRSLRKRNRLDSDSTKDASNGCDETSSNLQHVNQMFSSPSKTRLSPEAKSTSTEIVQDQLKLSPDHQVGEYEQEISSSEENPQCLESTISECDVKNPSDIHLESQDQMSLSVSEAEINSQPDILPNCTAADEKPVISPLELDPCTNLNNIENTIDLYKEQDNVHIEKNPIDTQLNTKVDANLNPQPDFNGEKTDISESNLTCIENLSADTKQPDNSQPLFENSNTNKKSNLDTSLETESCIDKVHSDKSPQTSDHSCISSPHKTLGDSKTIQSPSVNQESKEHKTADKIDVNSNTLPIVGNNVECNKDEVRQSSPIKELSQSTDELTTKKLADFTKERLDVTSANSNEVLLSCPKLNNIEKTVSTSLTLPENLNAVSSLLPKDSNAKSEGNIQIHSSNDCESIDNDILNNNDFKCLLRKDSSCDSKSTDYEITQSNSQREKIKSAAIVNEGIKPPKIGICLPIPQCPTNSSKTRSLPFNQELDYRQRLNNQNFPRAVRIVSNVVLNKGPNSTPPSSEMYAKQFHSNNQSKSLQKKSGITSLFYNTKKSNSGKRNKVTKIAIKKKKSKAKTRKVNVTSHRDSDQSKGCFSEYEFNSSDSDSKDISCYSKWRSQKQTPKKRFRSSSLDNVNNTGFLPSQQNDNADILPYDLSMKAKKLSPTIVNSARYDYNALLRKKRERLDAICRRVSLINKGNLNKKPPSICEVPNPIENLNNLILSVPSIVINNNTDKKQQNTESCTTTLNPSYNQFNPMVTPNFVPLSIPNRELNHASLDLMSLNNKEAFHLGNQGLEPKEIVQPRNSLNYQTTIKTLKNKDFKKSLSQIHAKKVRKRMKNTVRYMCLQSDGKKIVLKKVNSSPDSNKSPVDLTTRTPEVDSLSNDPVLAASNVLITSDEPHVVESSTNVEANTLVNQATKNVNFPINGSLEPLTHCNLEQTINDSAFVQHADEGKTLLLGKNTSDECGVDECASKNVSQVQIESSNKMADLVENDVYKECPSSEIPLHSTNVNGSNAPFSLISSNGTDLTFSNTAAYSKGYTNLHNENIVNENVLGANFKIEDKDSENKVVFNTRNATNEVWNNTQKQIVVDNDTNDDAISSIKITEVYGSVILDPNFGYSTDKIPKSSPPSVPESCNMIDKTECPPELQFVPMDDNRDDNVSCAVNVAFEQNEVNAQVHEFSFGPNHELTRIDSFESPPSIPIDKRMHFSGGSVEIRSEKDIHYTQPVICTPEKVSPFKLYNSTKMKTSAMKNSKSHRHHTSSDHSLRKSVTPSKSIDEERNLVPQNNLGSKTMDSQTLVDGQNSGGHYMIEKTEKPNTFRIYRQSSICSDRLPAKNLPISNSVAQNTDKLHISSIKVDNLQQDLVNIDDNCGPHLAVPKERKKSCLNTLKRHTTSSKGLSPKKKSCPSSHSADNVNSNCRSVNTPNMPTKNIARSLNQSSGKDDSILHCDPIQQMEACSSNVSVIAEKHINCESENSAYASSNSAMPSTTDGSVNAPPTKSPHEDLPSDTSNEIIVKSVGGSPSSKDIYSVYKNISQKCKDNVRSVINFPLSEPKLNKFMSDAKGHSNPRKLALRVLHHNKTPGISTKEISGGYFEKKLVESAENLTEVRQKQKIEVEKAFVFTNFTAEISPEQKSSTDQNKGIINKPILMQGVGSWKEIKLYRNHKYPKHTFPKISALCKSSATVFSLEIFLFIYIMVLIFCTYNMVAF